MNHHWSQYDFVVVDVEGTGNDPQEIIELAVVPITQGSIAETKHEWMIRPAKPVTKQASKLHGILDSDLARKPKFSDVSSEIADVLGHYAVVGHNVGVDVQLLREELPSWQPMVAIDTLRLAKYVIPGAASYALDALVNNLGIGDERNRKAHRATSDALVTAQLFLALTNMLEKRGELHLRTLAEMSASVKDPFFKTTQQSLF